MPSNENSPNLLKTRHTASHVMAMAVQRVKKDAQITIGPWIDTGFYYDFFFPGEEQLVEADLKKIKKEMDKIIKADLPLIREEVSREEARKRIERHIERQYLERWRATGNNVAKLQRIVTFQFAWKHRLLHCGHRSRLGCE